MSFLKYRVMKRLFLFAVCAWAGLSLWASGVKGQGTACETRSEKAPAKVYMIKEIRLSGLISFIIYTLAGAFSDRVSQAVPCPFTPEAHRERPAHAQTANKNKRFMTLYFKKLILHSIPPPLLQSSDTRLPACCPLPSLRAFSNGSSQRWRANAYLE